MAAQSFDVASSKYSFTSHRFLGGIADPALAFFDFEDWEAGTAGWQLNPNYAAEHPNQPASLDIAVQQLNNLGRLRVDSATDIFVDTSSGVLFFTLGGINHAFPADASTPQSVCAFNFESISIGPRARIITSGDKPLVLSSTSSIMLNAEISPAPGTLGGFSGGSEPSIVNGGVNENGAASGNRRVYQSTVTTTGRHMDEVQRITAQAEMGHTPRGSFVLVLGNERTHSIDIRTSASEMKRIIQGGLLSIGQVEVQRVEVHQSRIDWLVTFAAAAGDLEQLLVDDRLTTGVNSAVIATTLQDGNEIGGSFALSWNGQATGNIQANATAAELQHELTTAWTSAGVDLIHVRRTVDRNLQSKPCILGGCSELGTDHARGHTYFISLVTSGQNTAFARKADISTSFAAAPVQVLVHASALTGTGAQVVAQMGHVGPALALLPFNTVHGESHFSLAFGGNGASAAGRGGLGHSFLDPPVADNTSALLLPGGSGGCMGGMLPHDALYFGAGAAGHGGPGGASVQLLAVGDIVIGPDGGIDVSGGDGQSAFRAGGGGAGGTIALVAGSSVVNHGKLAANGGDGGDGVGSASYGGGGGGGGRIHLQADSVSDSAGLASAIGGTGGKNEFLVAGNRSQEAHEVFLKTFGFERTSQFAQGENGQVQVISSGGARYSLDSSVGGAENTPRCMKVSLDEKIHTDSNITVPAPYQQNGPAFHVRSKFASTLDSSANTAMPGRLTVYLRMGSFLSGNVASNTGAQVVLHDDTRNASGQNAGGIAGDARGMVGVGIVNGHWRHDANYHALPGLLLHQEDPSSVISRFVQSHRWYKVDVLLNWTNQTYRIRIDDQLVALDMPFHGQAVTRVGVYLFDAGEAWFDELYVGNDDTMGFECPITTQAAAALRMQRPIQSGWLPSDLGKNSSLDNETQSLNHIVERQRYNNSVNGGLVFFDGSAHEWYVNAILTQTPDGDHSASFGGVDAGALLFVAGSTTNRQTLGSSMSTSAGGSWTAGTGAGEGGSSLGETGQPAGSGSGQTGRWYWYGEHDSVNLDNYLDGTSLDMVGGVGSCSTDDMISWRNEGIVLHYANISDDVYGWGNLANKTETGVHEVYAHEEKFRLSYANALDPFYERDMHHSGDPYSPAFMRNIQGVIWHPELNMIKRTDGVTYNESMFRNSTISCTGSAQEHVSKRLEDREIATICGDLGAYFNQTLEIPDLCYFTLGYNHSALGLPSREVASSSPGGTFVYNTRYMIQHANLIDMTSGVSERITPENPRLVHELFVDQSGVMFIDGSAALGAGFTKDWKAKEHRIGNVMSYSGGKRVELICPRMKRFLYRAERPKVVFNNLTNEYVMWMHADDSYNLRRLVGTAASAHPGGPFSFERTFLPDGNETIDMTLLQPKYGMAPTYLVRTYFATTAYMLPLPIMQPIWESVQDVNGMIDFRLNFQRAVYDAGYDNPDDIYKQRWRMEDVPWKMTSGNWTESYFTNNKTFLLANSVTGAQFLYKPSDRDLVLNQAIPDINALFEISGQAQQLIISRFINPDNPANSYWSPDSVPAVKAQPWAENYEDKNIMDNPVHPTVADLLIGPHRKVQYRRTKYVAISLLDDTFRDTTGILRAIEGELTNEQDLISLTTVGIGNIFGWESGQQPGSTFPVDVTGEQQFGFVRQDDFYDRHHQFSREFNDRENDFRNFRDRQTRSRCPEIHHRAMAKQTECEDILNNQLEYVDSEPVLTAFDVLDNFARRGDVSTHSFARAMDTASYEDCLASHLGLLEEYQSCVHADTPNFDSLPLWKPGDRECVGGGGSCGPPAPGDAPRVEYGFTNSFTHSRQYFSMTNIYGDGGQPFRTAPASRKAVYSRPPPRTGFSPKAQEFGAYDRSTPWQ